QHNPETVRFLLLGTHYRSPIEWSDDRLTEVKRSLDSFYRFFERYQRITLENFYQVSAPTRRAPFVVEENSVFLAEVVRLREEFLAAMDDDFNTGGALGSVFELLTTLNRFADQARLEEPNPAPTDLAAFKRGVVVLRELGQILGLFN